LAKLSYPHHVFLTPNDADDPCVTICAYAVVQVLPHSSSQLIARRWASHDPRM